MQSSIIVCSSMLRKLFILLFSVSIGISVCPSGWENIEQRPKEECYKLVDNNCDRLTRGGANARCVEIGGYLSNLPDGSYYPIYNEYAIRDNRPLNDLTLLGVKSGVDKNGNTYEYHPRFPGQKQEVFDIDGGAEGCLVFGTFDSMQPALYAIPCDGVIEGVNATGFSRYLCKRDVIPDPTDWIIDMNSGSQLHRSQHTGRGVHHYTIDWRTTPVGFTREAGPGFVVSEDRFHIIKSVCPGLVQVGIWRSGGLSYIGNNPPVGFVKRETFYCATRQFACGANFLLRLLEKQGGGDLFYPSSENEANQQLLGYSPGIYNASWFKETPCWIWKDRTDTWHTIAMAAGGMIWGGYKHDGIVHFYTLQRHLIPGGFAKTAGPGYVVLQQLYDNYFKTRCPDLIPMRIWHGQNGKGQTITWIGKEGKNPPATLQKNVQLEELRFYCAPRQNYCNANFLLRRMNKNDGSTYFYPRSEEEAWNQLRGEYPEVFKNTKWNEEVCYIWAKW